MVEKNDDAATTEPVSSVWASKSIKYNAERNSLTHAVLLLLHGWYTGCCCCWADPYFSFSLLLFYLCAAADVYSKYVWVCCSLALLMMHAMRCVRSMCGEEVSECCGCYETELDLFTCSAHARHHPRVHYHCCDCNNKCTKTSVQRIPVTYRIVNFH